MSDKWLNLHVWMAAILNGGHVGCDKGYTLPHKHQGTLIRDGYESSTAFFLEKFFFPIYLHTTSL